MVKFCVRFFLVVFIGVLIFNKQVVNAGEYSDSTITNFRKNPKEKQPLRIQKEKTGIKTFIINTCLTDLDEFKKLVQSASRLKKFGTVQINIATLADKSFHEIPKGGNPWNEYACYNAAVFKFFPDKKIATYIPAAFVEKNKKLLLAKAKMLKEHGMEAAFFANEPGFLPAAFFEQYPQMRGPRVDHPRRSIAKAFSPCMSIKETQEMYTNMIEAMLKAAPEIKSFYYKTNDAGSGNCWSDWLYSGPNGPDHCKEETTGERIQDFMNALKAGASKANVKLDIYLSHPQGSSNFSEAERNDIQNHLPEGCYFKNTQEHETRTITSDFSSLYPVKGIFDALSLLNDFKTVDRQNPQTVFINFNSFYARGNQNDVVANLTLEMIADYLQSNSDTEMNTLQKLQGYCEKWGGKDNAEYLYQAFAALNNAFSYKATNLGNLYGINWNVAARMINRPLVAVPQRLSKEEESYFLPYVFNVSVDEARMDYLDIQGGRWQTKPDSVKFYVKMIESICTKLEAINKQAPEYEFIHQMALSLRIHASLVRSCGNFAVAQMIRDNNADKLNGPIHRPGKEGSWVGDSDLLRFNLIMRDELDNTEQLIRVLENGGLNNLCKAKDAQHEDTFLLGSEIINQLKKKRKIMLDHWRDIENYLTTPFK